MPNVIHKPELAKAYAQALYYDFVKKGSYLHGNGRTHKLVDMHVAEAMALDYGAACAIVDSSTVRWFHLSRQSPGVPRSLVLLTPPRMLPHDISDRTWVSRGDPAMLVAGVYFDELAADTPAASCGSTSAHGFAIAAGERYKRFHETAQP